MSSVADMSETPPPRVAVVGCGNTNRTDDGVGPHVIALLGERSLPPDVALHDGGTDGMGVMYRARGVDHLIIVDAKAPEGRPAAIYHVPGDELEAVPPSSFTLHDFRWDHALYAGRKIFGVAFPSRVDVFLVEAHDLSLGLDLTPDIAFAAEAVADRIVGMVQPHIIPSA